MAGVLYGIGVGPGDPELMTQKAVRIAGECEIIGIPAAEAASCTAYQIACRAVANMTEKPVLEVAIPMTRDQAELEEAYEKGCEVICEKLAAGKNVAFLNLGDPTVYGTYMTLHEKVRQAGFDAVIISGVPSFCAVAAALGLPLGSGREEIHILPGCYGREAVSAYPGTRILMKSGGSLGEVTHTLADMEERGLAKAFAVTNCGMPDEKVYRKIRELEGQAGYFTTVIVKEPDQKQFPTDQEQYIIKNQKKLRWGITTGTCAAAAACAAARRLLLQADSEKIELKTPKGTRVNVPVSLCLQTDSEAEYMAVKDSGDDPDVTNHVRIYVRIEKLPGEKQPDLHAFCSPEYPNLFLDGAEGVGRIREEGLEQRVGQAAINAVPRSMIFDAVGQVCRQTDYRGRLLIVIRIPEGIDLAGRTFNGRLGIEGGISVLGTSGIIEPMSERAIVDTIEAQIRRLAMQGRRQLLVMPGNYGQAYAGEALGLDLDGSIKCSNYIGETLDLAVAYEMQSLLLIGNIGKLIKTAAGIMNTHSRVADARGEIMAVHTVLCGGTRQQAEIILGCINTDQMLTHLDEWGLKETVMRSLCAGIDRHIACRVQDKLRVGVYLFSEKYGLIGQTREAAQLLEACRRGGNVPDGKESHGGC